MSARSDAALAVASHVPDVTVHPLAQSDEGAWDAYVMQHPHADFFCLTAWKRVLVDGFGYKPCFFVARRGGQIAGLLPLFLVSNLVTGKKLISVPFGVYGGVVADDAEVEAALHAAAADLGRELKVDYIELRYRDHSPVETWIPVEQYVTFTTTLEANDDAMMKKLPRDTRYMVRKGIKAGLVGKHGLDQMDLFFDLFAKNMQNHGTPMFPRKYFAALEKHLGTSLDLLVIWNGDQPIAGVLSFLYKDSILPYYAGVTEEARKVAGNNFLYWDLMSWSIARGIRNFDFGRSKKNTGAFDFKNAWGMDVKQLDYKILLVERKTAPNFSPTNSKFAAAAKIWGKLPLAATKMIGPLVSPWFP